jgi:hypothetical protein
MAAKHKYYPGPGKNPPAHTETRWVGARAQPKRTLPKGGTPHPVTGKKPKHLIA